MNTPGMRGMDPIWKSSSLESERKVDFHGYPAMLVNDEYLLLCP